MSGEKKSHYEMLLPVMAGAAIALATTWFWQSLAESRSQENIAAILKRSISQEVSLCQLAVKEMHDVMTNGTANGNAKILPQDFDSLHQPSLYLETRAKVIELKPEVVDAVIVFDFSLHQAQTIRDLNRKGLEVSRGDITKSGVTPLYEEALRNLIETGNEAVKVLDKNYPNLKRRK
jgi:hypothetical protein